MNSKIHSDSMDELFSAILSLNTVDECYDFFQDLCTVKELLALDQRFQVAKMLDKSNLYSEIVRATGASTATISRVNRSLHYGNDGYKTILNRMKTDAGV